MSQAWEGSEELPSGMCCFHRSPSVPECNFSQKPNRFIEECLRRVVQHLVVKSPVHLQAWWHFAEHL